MRYGGPDCPLASYNWFSNGEEPDSNHSSTKDSTSGTRMKRLKRGYSSEADQLLNWLVSGELHDTVLLLTSFWLGARNIRSIEKELSKSYSTCYIC